MVRGYSWGLASIGLMVCIIMLIMSKPFVTYNSPENNNVTHRVKLFFFIFTLNLIFSFWEWDTYHSWWGFVAARNYEEFAVRGNYEPVYFWLTKISGSNYFVWRALIWVPACFFIYYAGKRLDILNRNLLLSISLFMAFLTCTRNLLGISMLLVGLILFIDEKEHSRIWGIGLIVASYFFHKSMYITIMFALLAFLPQNKKSIRFLLLLYPIFTMAATYIINNIASGGWVISLGAGGGGNGMIEYAQRERAVSTFFGKLNKTITYVPQYLALIYVTKRVIFDKCLVNDYHERSWTFLCKFAFVCIYIASTFYFTETSGWIYERFKYMGMIPLTFVVAKVWSIEPKTNMWIKSIILLQMFSLAVRWFIQYYQWS